MWISLQRFRKICKPQRGFTLIELLVVTAIIVIITTFVLLRQGRFDSSTLLRSLTYSVALTIRQAQVYGVSVRGASATQVNCAGNFSSGVCYAPAYGVIFNSPNSYVLFADLNGNGQFDDPNTAIIPDAVVKTFQLSKQFQIVQACASLSSTKECWTSDDSGALKTGLTIIFRRPNPDACFSSLTHPACDGTVDSYYDSAYIQLQATDDPANTHAVQVSTTGQIAVLGAGQ